MSVREEIRHRFARLKAAYLKARAECDDPRRSLRESEFLRLSAEQDNCALRQSLARATSDLQAFTSREEELRRSLRAASEQEAMRQGEQTRLLHQIERLQLELFKARGASPERRAGAWMPRG